MKSLYQIYYDRKSELKLLSGFMPLDNTSNERPDWYEYWPIRRFLLGNNYGDEQHLGFFSPKFNEKTTLDFEKVSIFYNKNKSADLISLSPFFDQSAIYLNPCQQAEFAHKEMKGLFDQVFEFLGLPFKSNSLVMSSHNTIFCNYFIANGAFWRRWLGVCERIFEMAEKTNAPLSRRLNSPVGHRKAQVHSKVFVIERIASLLLLQDPSLKIAQYNPSALPNDNVRLNLFRNELVTLDSLKHSYRLTGNAMYMRAYAKHREMLMLNFRFAYELKNRKL